MVPPKKAATRMPGATGRRAGCSSPRDRPTCSVSAVSTSNNWAGPDRLVSLSGMKTVLYLLLATAPPEVGADAITIQFCRRDVGHEPIHVGEWVELGIDYPSHRLASFARADLAGDSQEVDLGTMYQNGVVQTH